MPTYEELIAQLPQHLRIPMTRQDYIEQQVALGELIKANQS